MSIVAAVIKDNQIAIAADTQSLFGDVKVPMDNFKTNKVRKVGNSYLAITGWGVYDNILNDYINPKRPPNLANPKLIYAFFQKLWRALQENYAFVNQQSEEKNSPFVDLAASFLVVNKNGIFSVAPDMSVSRFEKYYAVGSGWHFALGAVHALYPQKLSAAELAKKAVETTIAFRPDCGGEVQVIRVK